MIMIYILYIYYYKEHVLAPASGKVLSGALWGLTYYLDFSFVRRTLNALA